MRTTLSQYLCISCACIVSSLVLFNCSQYLPDQSDIKNLPRSDFIITEEHNQDRFGNDIPPVISVPSGSIIEAYTVKHKAERQIVDTDPDAGLKGDEYFPFWFTGPVYVENAHPGDVLAVTILEIEVTDYGWIALFPGFGLLADDFTEPIVKTFPITQNSQFAQFSENISVPLNPFLGVMAVAPDTDTLKSAIEPREFGGNMDNPYLTVGTTVYFPVFVEGGLFSVGDAHAAQGMGEVSGTALETAVRVKYKIELRDDFRQIKEPQYETDDFYAVGAYGTTLEHAVTKATRFMIDYLVTVHGLSSEEAYMLCSIAGDLNITEVVDKPHMYVTMHISKDTLGI